VLCQAKIMDIATGNYNHLDHVVGGPTGGRYQVDILREYAKTQNALACYVLYNSGLSNLSGQFDPTNTGCFVVSADDINTQIIAHVHAQYTGDTSLTWQAIKPKASTWDVLATYLYPLQ